MPVNSLIVGVDLSPIKPIPKVITFQSDITTEQCRATIRKHFKTWKADTVLHDGAPNVGTAWVQDSFNQAELALQSMKLATEFLVEGGTFVTKVFRSKDYNSLLWVFNQLFDKVEATKPPSSRNVSAEIFVVCRGFKAPKRIDPKFLDPRAVFEELAAPTPNNEAKVYNPEIKKRKRDGYEEGDWTQFKEVPAFEFIQTTDPIAILGSKNRLHFDQPKNGDVALAALNKMPETTDEIRRCCEDLKVLGRKEFKILLKWRLKVREIFGFPNKKTAEPEVVEETAAVESMDEEMRIQEELQALKDRESNRKKKDRRKENEQKQKDIVRMQLNMTAPMDIGMEQEGPQGDDSMFQLKTIDKGEGATLNRIAKGKMVKLNDNAAKKSQVDEVTSDEESDDEEDRLERELDGMYDAYKERKSATDAKYRAKRSRKEHDDDEWEGVSADEKAASDDDESELEEDSEEDSDAENGLPSKSLLTDLDNEQDDPSGLSKRARAFFNQDLFKDVEGLLDEPAEEEDAEDEAEVVEVVEEMEVDEISSDEDMPDVSKRNGKIATDAPDDDDGKVDSKAVTAPKPAAKDKNDDDDDESDWEEEEKRKKKVDGRPGEYSQTTSRGLYSKARPKQANHSPDIDIITAEAMTLAHELATGKKSSHDLIDDGFNRHAFRDRDGLPEWFVEDESRHDKQQKPITKAAAQAIKEKLRAYNARPIKKVREAKARKKQRAADRIEKLKKKSDVLAASEGLTEREKADSISKLLSKATKKAKRPPIKVVVARGANKGKGRPQGVKGRYKMVDSRMKKEMRALRRKAKSKK